MGDEGNIKALVIDDDEGVCDTLASMLTLINDGIVVDKAYDGEEGLNKFYEGQYNIIFTDLNMPKKTGVDVIQGVRKKDKNIPIILVTGYEPNSTYGALDETVRTLIEEEDILKKPFKQEQIKGVLTRYFPEPKKISIFHRDEVLTEIFKYALEQEGYDAIVHIVDENTTPSDVMAMIKKDDPHLVLLAVNYKPFQKLEGGLATLDEIRKEPSIMNLPVAMISGSREYSSEATSKGAAYLLLSPGVAGLTQVVNELTTRESTGTPPQS